MMNCCCCESQQEAWIREAAEGKPNRFRKDNPRVIDMLESFDCTPPYVDIERARYFTESMKQTEGQHLTLRWAKSVFGNFSFYSYKKACGQKKTVRGSKNSRRLSNGTPAI